MQSQGRGSGLRSTIDMSSAPPKTKESILHSFAGDPFYSPQFVLRMEKRDFSFPLCFYSSRYCRNNTAAAAVAAGI
ncbi:hypothetical protein I7I53_10856 [Histoplasma capsulatum var. duboisii H88]|uniref:Uncharacterized protein n=1 Tax=Ajellomyces capsulatus (strain H88) TaxID=544711 RepID=A0A8A1L758_AJEC8|nr:hypothetical protein I7I53_10856 [Histoplasma capsulatum var. duboisii H88]